MGKKALAIAVSALCLTAVACSGGDANEAAKTVTQTVTSAQSSATQQATSSSQSPQSAQSTKASASHQAVDDDDILVYTVTVEGAPAEVIYADENGAEQHEQGVEGSWTKTVTFPDDHRIQAGYLGANIKGQGTVTCKIEHEGEVVAESSQTGNYAYANCPIERDLD